MRLNKTIIRYFLSAIGVFLFARIYTLFGHGVTSHWMSNAYLYLLGLGAFVFILLKIIAPEVVQYKGYGLFCQTYNSGVAILINGMLLYGILEIAGGTSTYVSWFLGVGCGLMAIGVVLFIRMIISKNVLPRSV
jgi:Protein of unknown function (DUF2871)